MREVKSMSKKTFGVIGVCGANGNLIARILKERGYDVIGTDLSSIDDCRFAHSLDGYDMELYYGETPDEFFEKSDCVVPPASLSKKSAIFNKIDNVYELMDVINNHKGGETVRLTFFRNGVANTVDVVLGSAD